nr:FAD binding domain-containing protein [Olsenella profusa]
MRFESYTRPETPEEALELLRSDRRATVVGGMMWLRLADRTVPLGIDLSRCGLDHIEETEDAFVIGAMVTLGQMERHEALSRATAGVLSEAVSGIVGTQFRNLATVGGSVWSRMGFSDVICALLALDTEVELAGAGRMPLIPFVERGAGRDVLTHVIVRKHRYRAAFASMRPAATDFSALNAAAGLWRGSWHVAVGARPQKAQALTGGERLPLREGYSPTELASVLSAAADLSFGSDLRGTEAWRRAVAPELVRRTLAAAHAKEA